ncbi:hypothetical protein HPP92_008422 [Vanilla planifolia]|uniref:RING-type domain-containing protein n=1 Tax=Vanilla planifolia TaxID=51239 RepID=A0A835RHZ1_VANPL|nr:hypothetical protein HPP92_008422 [Vanilla planifolia]
MGGQQSKEELLYQQVNYGNIEGVKSLRREGAGLEWVDKEGKTPLILACLRPDLVHIAKALLEMGANVNAYRPGTHAGTPLHHAAKRGLESTVNLLLSHGANPLVMNDDCQTALDLARAKHHANVVRAIETRICLFAGWLREITGPSILEAFAPQWVSKKIWAVVLPCNSRNPTNPQKFELAIYPDLQVSRPRTVVALWKAQIEEPKFNQTDPALIIVETSKKSRFKFLSANEGDKQQMQWLYNACRGICQSFQAQNSNFVSAPAVAPPLPNQFPATSSPRQDDVELAMAINASIQTALVEGVPLHHGQQVAGIDATNGWGSSTITNTTMPSSDRYNGWAIPEGPQSNVGPNGTAPQPQSKSSNSSHASQNAPADLLVPSAPPILDEMAYDGPIFYPSIDSSPVDLAVPPMEEKVTTKESKEDGSSCVICLDAPVQGACIPCGHMAGCMSCLKEIKAKKGECPVCRGKIDQVVRLYAV